MSGSLALAVLTRTGAGGGPERRAAVRLGNFRNPPGGRARPLPRKGIQARCGRRTPFPASGRGQRCADRGRVPQTYPVDRLLSPREARPRSPQSPRTRLKAPTRPGQLLKSAPCPGHGPRLRKHAPPPSWQPWRQRGQPQAGACRSGDENDAVRWIAIRHGPDHIHLVAMLARQDRTRPRVWNERYRVRDACLAAEEVYGLRSTAPADRTAARCPTRAETGKAERRSRGEPARRAPRHRPDQVLHRGREPAAATDAACAASDALHVTAAALGSSALRQAADDLDRAARQPWGRIPAPTPAGNQLRHAARLISAYAYHTGDRTLIPMVLLVRLAALAEAVAELRESQQRAAQAAAALRAARHLRTATQVHAHQAIRQAERAHYTTRTETSPATPSHRCRSGPAQLPHPAWPTPARTRPARTRSAPAAPPRRPPIASSSVQENHVPWAVARMPSAAGPGSTRMLAAGVRSRYPPAPPASMPYRQPSAATHASIWRPHAANEPSCSPGIPGSRRRGWGPASGT
jgi:hypothetical protein